MSYKIICDLSVTSFGFSGIAFDTRTMFVALCRQSELDVSGLLQDLRGNAKYTGGEDIENQINFLNLLIKPDNLHLAKNRATALRILLEISRKIKLTSIAYRLQIPKYIRKTLTILDAHKTHELTQVDHQLNQLILQNFLQQSVYPDDFNLVLEKNYYLSTYRQLLLKLNSLRKRPMVKLNTSGFDFAIFQDGVPIAPNVSAGTIPLIRYHDAIPLLFPETLQHRDQTPKLHISGVKNPPQNAIFVCNSKPTQNDLISIAPHLKDRAVTIPPAYYVNTTIAKSNMADLLPIILARASSKSISPAILNQDILKNTAQELINQEAEYLIAVSTIEPRKNYLMLIQAWELARKQCNKKLKLIIVGNHGWKFEETYQAMAPHVQKADIIQLERVTTEELQILYTHAIAFISLSIFEGFGSPTIEAMQCRCPAILSDIPTYRWVAGDAAKYVDLNNIQSMAEDIAAFVNAPQAYRDEFVTRATERIQAYSIDSVGKQWFELCDHLKKNNGILN